MQLCSSLNILWHCPSLRLEWKHLFQSCGHWWVFHICWHITECSTLTTSPVRSWDSSAGIPSPPLTFFCLPWGPMPLQETLKHKQVWLSLLWGSLLLSLGFWFTEGFFVCVLQASLAVCISLPGKVGLPPPSGSGVPLPFYPFFVINVCSSLLVGLPFNMLI